MKATEVKELFRQIAQNFFSDSVVIFSKQSRISKPELRLITLTSGNLTRPNAPNYRVIEGYEAGHYLNKLPITIDLFTHGRALTVGSATVYENTALEELIDFATYLNSREIIYLSHKNDVTILIDPSEITDLTDIVNDNNYEYRSRVVVNIYFTDVTYGFSGKARTLEEAKEASNNTGWFNEAEISEEKGNTNE